MDIVEKYLEQNGIEFIPHKHPAVFTCEEAETHCSHLPGLPCKNLFLRDEKKKAYFLCVLPAAKKVDLKKIAGEAGLKRISFAGEKDLLAILGLTPGSVSPFGLINDKEARVTVFLDREVYNADIVTFHPNRNTASLELTGEMFRKYLGTLSNSINVTDV